MDYNVSEFLKLFREISWKIGQTLQDWGTQLLQNIVEQTNSIQGALFCADSKQEFLYLTAYYGLKNPDKYDEGIAFGDGILGSVAKFQKIKQIDEKIPRQFANYWLGEELIPASIILIPIVFNNITYGVMEYTRDYKYKDDEVFLFQAIMQTVGVQLILLLKEQQQKQLLYNLSEKNNEILEKSKVLQMLNEEIILQKSELEEKNAKVGKTLRNIKIISEFGQKITASFDISIISKIAYDYVSTLMETSAFGIGIYNEVMNSIEFPDFKEFNFKLPYFSKQLDEEHLSTWCFNNSKDLFINNLPEEYGKYIKTIPDFGVRPMPISLIYVPLTIQNKTVGVITVNSYKTNVYKKDDLVNLKAIGAYIAIALDNGKAYEIIKDKNKNISESINYGKKIQQAVLPLKKDIFTHFETFIIFRPKDVVSGDFYWFAHEKLDNHQTYNFIAAVDCTGHGVPGAFMSLIGTNMLNEIIKIKKIYEPQQILKEIDNSLKLLLKKEENNTNDGMDICLCRIEKLKTDNSQLTNYKIIFAGAKRPLIFYNSIIKQVTRIKGTSISIGVRQKIQKQFEQVEIRLVANDILYLTSDGYIDQCNIQRQALGTNKLIENITNIATLPMPTQQKNLENELDEYKKDAEQRDDILIVGIKLLIA